MRAGLSQEPECRRGHGAVYDAVSCGRIQVARLRRALAGLPLPAWEDGRIRLAAAVSNCLRPDAEASPQRLFCHCYARGKGNAQLIPGWPYSFVVALEPGRTSWTLPLDAVRLGSADDATAVTAAQIREVVMRIIDARHWRDGDPDILVVFDADYDLTRLAWLLDDLPVEIAGRLRSDRVMSLPAPARQPGTGGRPPRHGADVAMLVPPPTTRRDPVVGCCARRSAGRAGTPFSASRKIDAAAGPGRCHCGGPAVRCRLLVERCPGGLTQVTEIVSPGWNRDRMPVRSSGEPTACPFTVVMTAPPVMPAEAAGLPQIVPTIKVPELTSAIADGTVSSALLV